MKTLTTRLATLAAGAIVLGGIAYGQMETMKADIPFAFRAGNTNMPAGTYTVSRVRNGSGVNVWLRSGDARHSVATLPGPLDIYNGGKPQVVFTCGGGICSLRQLRTSAGTVSYPGPHSSDHKAQSASLVSIPLSASGE